MAQTSNTLPHAVGPTHPVYQTWRPVWALLADVYEGSGGFLDGTYLIAHPREWKDHAGDQPKIPTKKLLERRALARYENVAALIIEQKLASLFREPPTRRVAGDDPQHPWLLWAANVDGSGRSMDTWLREQMRLAMVFGHMVCLMDRAGDSGPTAADASPLLLRAYTPLDVIDWLQDDAGTLTGIKAVEPVMRTTLDEPFLGQSTRYRTLTVTAEQAVRLEHATPAGAVAASDAHAHNFGVLPVTVLYAQRRAFTPLIGQSVLYDPFLYVDVFNLTSEIRELLRKQTFSMLNIPLGVNPNGGTSLDVETAKTLAGTTTGTSNVLFTALPAQYVSADTANVTVYQAERAELLRTIYRLTAVPFDQDSREAESAEARKLKREEFTAMVGKYADELHAAETHLAELWFRGTYGDTWQREWDAAEPSISYPQAFGEPTWAEIGEEMAAAELTDLRESVTFRQEYAAKQLPRFLPDATPVMVGAIRDEIAALPSPAEQAEQARAALSSSFAARTEDDATEEA